jgi:hypothetical protein
VDVLGVVSKAMMESVIGLVIVCVIYLHVHVLETAIIAISAIET